MNVINWISAQKGVDLYLSVVTVGEIRKGIEMARPTSFDHAVKLETWVSSLVGNYQARIIPFDEKAAQVWGKLMVLRPHVSMEDTQIAAIETIHDMTVVTRNERDLSQLGVAFFNPF